MELSGNDRDGYELAGVDWKPEQAADEDIEEEARRAKEAAERQADLKAKMDALRAQLDADDQVDKDASRKAAEADPGTRPTPTVASDQEATEVAQEAPQATRNTIRATPRPQYPQEYADSEENLAQWRADVFRSRDRDSDRDTPTDYPMEVEVDA